MDRLECDSNPSAPMHSPTVYLDYNATTPIAPEVLDALLPYLQHRYGNASSSYALGQQSKRAVETARQHIATMLEADAASEILLLSGGTESINYAIKGTAAAEEKQQRATGCRVRKHIITSRVEHVAVLETCRYLERERGYDVTYLPVDSFGRITTEQVLAAITPATFLISLMLANNEVGTLQPIAEIVRNVQQFVETHPEEYSRVLIHTDASQAIGKINVSVKDLGIDFLTIAGHKLYAPKAIGALYMRADAPTPAVLIHGASHEQGRRAGTENVTFDVALGTACALIHENLKNYEASMKASKQFLLDAITQKLAGLPVAFCVNGHPEAVLPNTLSISFQNISAVELLAYIETQGICASAGSACHTHTDGETVQVSNVLQAMNVPRDFALGTLRLSVGRTTVQNDLIRAATAIIGGIRQQL